MKPIGRILALIAASAVALVAVALAVVGAVIGAFYLFLASVQVWSNWKETVIGLLLLLCFFMFWLVAVPWAWSGRHGREHHNPCPVS